ncbi:ABC transporter permease [Streptomyces sp. NPDC047130]|uniref:ABC transporter permease n=1 Tax=Streptomyces sp. NPDC047130 TaxID=3155261 RepID=UPI0033DEE92F
MTARPGPADARDGLPGPADARDGPATRLRAFAGTSVALALLVAVTATLAAAFPRAVDRYTDAGLRRAVAQALPDATTVQVQAALPRYPSVEEAEDVLRPGPLAAARAEVLAAAQAPLTPDRARSAYGVRTAETVPVTDPWLPRPTGTLPEVVLAAQQDLASHTRVTEGRLPRTTGGTATSRTTRIEAAVTADTARTLRIRVGSVIHVPTSARGPLAVRITGIVVPRDPRGAYWSVAPVLRTPALHQVPGSSPPDRYWVGGLLIAPDAGPALLGVAGLTRYWNVSPDAAALRGHDLDRLASAVAALESGPGGRRLRATVDENVDIQTRLDEVLAGQTRLRSGIDPLVLLAAVGTGALAVIVLAMAAGVAADRRRGEAALLRARGASPTGLALRLLAETAAVAVPAGALGLTAALLLLPGARTAPAVAAALAVTLFACLALPARVMAAHRTVRTDTGREDLVSARPSRRRTVAELAVLVIAAGTVVALRRQGSGGAGPVAAAPVLTGVVAALLLVRLQPLPLRALGRATARARGAVVPLSVAHAARASGFAVLPLLALLTALTTAAFGGSVLAGVTAARDRAALLAVGADGRVESTTGALPGTLPDRVRRLPGVRAVTEAGVAYEAKARLTGEPVPLAGVDPGAYARLAEHTGLGPFDAARLGRNDTSGGDAGRTLPALASPHTAEVYGTGPWDVLLPDGSTVTVRVVDVVEHTPAVVGDDFLVVDRSGLPREAARATTLLLTGDTLDGRALRAAAGGPGGDPGDPGGSGDGAGGGPGGAGDPTTGDPTTGDPTAGTAAAADDAVGVRLRGEERGRHVDSPLQSGAERLYTVAVAAGAGYAAVALLLTVLRTAPERTALLARLRTMGMTRSQGRRLLILTALPQACLAAVGGTLTGWAAVHLLAPGVDLTAVALTSPPTTGEAVLRVDPLSLAVPALTVLLLAVGVPAVHAWWAGRRGSVRELRLGDA